MLKTIGYIIFGISMLVWLMIPIVPFLGFSVGKVAGITTGLVITGEVTFYLSIFMIGKEFLVKIKNKFRLRKAKANEVLESDDIEK